MTKQLIAVFFILFFCAGTQALCAWTEQNCKADGSVCYGLGTATCRNYSCAYEQKPNGKLVLYNDENDIVATGVYDMSKSADINCTQAHQNMDW